MQNFCVKQDTEKTQDKRATHWHYYDMITRISRIFLILLLSLAIAAPVTTFGQQTRPARTGARTTVDLVVRGGTIVTMDSSRRVLEDGAVAVSKGLIVAVGTRTEIESKYTSRQTVDATGKIVIPGLINGHTHIPMTLFRGLADDLDLNEWLTKFIFPAEAKNVTEEFVRAGTRLGLAEMIRGGTTTYCDMYYFEDAIADETSRAGVRGVLGETVIDFPVADNKTHAEAMAYTEKFVKKWQTSRLITPAIAPHAPYTVSEEHLRAVKSFSDRTKSPIVIHLAETRKEVDDITKDHGARPVDYLARINFLNARVIAAHVVFASPQEIDTLKRTGTGVVHNPQSNMKLASGVSPVPQMLSADVSVGLGSDGAASNNDLNLWEEMDTAAKLHKLTSGDPKVLSALHAFELATIRGARALHLESQIGSIEPGKRADLVLVDSDDLSQVPSYNIYSTLVYSTKADDVLTVIIEGRIVMRDRRLLTLNESEIKLQAAKFRQQIIKSLVPSPPGE